MKDISDQLTRTGPNPIAISQAKKHKKEREALQPAIDEARAKVVYCYNNNVCPSCATHGQLKSRRSQTAGSVTDFVKCKRCKSKFTISDNWYDAYTEWINKDQVPPSEPDDA